MALEPSPVLSAEMPALAAAGAEQRRYPRRKMRRLVYVLLDDTNGGILRDLSEDGLTIQAVSPLQANAPVHLNFNLSHPRLHLEVIGRVIWSNPIGRAGIRFDDMPSRTRMALQNWLAGGPANAADFELLAGAGGQSEESESSEGRNAVAFAESEPLSSAAGTVSVDNDHDEDGEILADGPMLEFSWWPSPIPAHKFARFVDTLAVAASVLLFYVVFLSIARELLSWLPTLAVLAGSAAMFAGLYGLWFAAFRLGTPGAWMAGLAGDASLNDGTDEREGFRFR